jgi:hypothetical protein
LAHAGVKVVKTGPPAPVVQVSGESVHAVVALVTAQPPGSAQVGVRVVSWAAVQVGPGAVQVVGEGVAGPQAVPLAHAGVKVVKTGPLGPEVQVLGESAHGVVVLVTAHPPGSAHVGVRVVSWAAVQVGPGAVQLVALAVGGPQAVPLAHAGVKVVKTGPPAPVVQVSGESVQLVGVFAVRLQPPAAVQVAV